MPGKLKTAMYRAYVYAFPRASKSACAACMDMYVSTGAAVSQGHCAIVVRRSESEMRSKYMAGINAWEKEICCALCVYARMNVRFTGEFEW